MNLKEQRKKMQGAHHAAPSNSATSKRPLIIVAVFLVLILVLTAAFFLNQEHNDKLISEGEQVTVVFEEGSSANDFTNILFDAGIIDSRASFKSEVSNQGADSSLKPGTYSFTGSMSLSDIVKQLVSGPNAEATLTIPEGATMKTIASAVEKAYDKKVTAKQFLKACKNPSEFKDEFSFVDGVSNLEGFLFPKTYTLLKSDISAHSIIKQMLSQYQTETASLDYSYAQSQGLNAYQTLILASIVEKEGTSDTYAKVAAVFYNRLSNQGEPTYGLLGSDATTAYELGGDVEGYDWSTNSPYNTRKTKGLCPTPICSPSLETLQAVCNPDKNMSDYYFFSFWPNNDGGVDYYFDKTYADHQKTIADHS